MKASITILRSAAVAAVAAVGLMVPAAGAGAAPYPGGGNPPEVLPSGTPRANQAGSSATLPITGTDAVEFAAIAGVAIGAGVVLVRRNRRAATA